MAQNYAKQGKVFIAAPDDACGRPEQCVTDLFLVLINSKGSSTYDNFVQAIDLFFEEYPQYRKVLHIHSFNGMGYNALYGSPVVHAAQMCNDGASVEEILQYLTEILPTAAAFLGSALNLKPIMKIFDNSITTAAKYRGEQRLVGKAAKTSIANMEPGTPYELSYGNDIFCLEELHHLMVQNLDYEPASVCQIGAAVAANSGPRVLGAAFTRKKE